MDGKKEEDDMQQFPVDRCLGILLIKDGIIIRCSLESDDRTKIVVGGFDIDAGSIVRNPETKLWQYDDRLRSVLGLQSDPRFSSDAEAGKRLTDYMMPPAELRAVLLSGLN